MNEPNEERFSQDDLEPVIDSTPVEHIGGPDDGDFLPVHLNGARRDGVYAPQSEEIAPNVWVVRAMRFIPR